MAREEPTCTCKNPVLGKIPASNQLAADIKAKTCTAKLDKCATAVTVKSSVGAQ
jgi:hypothetical protein